MYFKFEYRQVIGSLFFLLIFIFNGSLWADFEPDQKLEVAIVGGGLSGLVAAYELEKSDCSYVLLEGSDRYGGRIQSRENPFGNGWFNFGGTFIDSGQVEIQNLVEQLGLTLFEWKDYPDFEYSSFHFSDENGQEQFLNEEELISAIFSDEIEILKMIQSDQIRVSADEEFKKKMDQFSVGSYLQKYGVSKSLEQFIKARLESLYARRLHDLTSLKLLFDIRIDFDEEWIEINPDHDEKYRVLGGSEQIIHGLVAEIPKNKRSLHSRVTRVEGVDGNYRIVMENGKSIFAKKIIAALPLNAMAKIDWKINDFPSTHIEAFKEAQYGQVTSIFLVYDRPIWHKFSHEGWVCWEQGFCFWDASNNLESVDQGFLRVYMPEHLGKELTEDKGGANCGSGAHGLVGEIVQKVDSIWPGGKLLGFCVESYSAAYPGSDRPNQYGAIPEILAPVGGIQFVGDFQSETDSSGYSDKGYMNGAVVSALKAVERIRDNKVRADHIGRSKKQDGNLITNSDIIVIGR